jgi:hypothetical protein
MSQSFHRRGKIPFLPADGFHQRDTHSLNSTTRNLNGRLAEIYWLAERTPGPFLAELANGKLCTALGLLKPDNERTHRGNHLHVLLRPIRYLPPNLVMGMVSRIISGIHSS